MYKAQLAITERHKKDGKQTTFWLDVDDNPPRHRMEKGLKGYREQMIGEAVLGHNTADHWNRMNPDQKPLQFKLDLTFDVGERLSVSEEMESAG